ncbi:MAG: MATE family efflux transporter, partial [Gemmataceae bacterium]
MTSPSTGDEVGETTSLPAHLQGPVWRFLVALAWPTLLQNWLTVLVHLSDRLLAGHFQNLEAADQVATQAAQTTAAYLAWFLVSYTTLVSVGSTALVARMIGAENRLGAVQVLHQSIGLAAVLGFAGLLLGLLTLEPGLAILHLREPTASYAADYLRPLLVQLPLQMVAMAGIACLIGAGDTRTGLFILGGVTLINLPLAWFFFLRMGFVGIAVGTAVSQAMGGLAVLAVLIRGRAGLRLNLSRLRPDFVLIRRILR